jgi:P pilus assembly chaperone PapD
MHPMSRYSFVMAKMLVLVIAVSVFASRDAAASELLVLPTRVVLEGRGSGDFQVINPADETVDYRVTVQHYSQQPNGILKLTDRISKRQLLAQKMIRYSPRKSTLKPKQKQIVRTLPRPVPNLPDGEYRLHLHFEPIALKPFEPENRENDTGLSIQIKLMVAVAVPVFYRHGETHLKMDVEAFEILPPKKIPGRKQVPTVSVRLRREGNRSAFGDVAILHKAPEAEGWTTIGKLGGVPIYMPNPTVTRKVALELAPGVSAASLQGQIRVEFRDREGDKKQILAEKIFNL